MAKRLGSVAVLAVAATLAACGGEEPPPTVDCAWFAGDNCWKATATEATSCTDGTATGTFNADTTFCDYGGGTTVAFATPANACYPSPADAPWSFAVQVGGAPCASVHETVSSFAVTTALGTFEEDWSGSAVLITCPGGEQVRIGVMDMIACDWNTLPGTVVSGTGGSMTFALLGGAEADPVLWSCAP